MKMQMPGFSRPGLRSDGVAPIVQVSGLPLDGLVGYWKFDEGRNLLKYSQQFDNAAWEKTNCYFNPNAGVAPDGTVTADKLIEEALNGSHLITQAVSLTADVAYAMSVYVKKGVNATAPDIIQVSGGSTAFGTEVYANFNITTGQVTKTGTATSAAIQDVGNGWYRCSITGVCVVSGSNTSIAILFCNNNPDSIRAPTYLGAVTSDVFVWGAQVQQGTNTVDANILRWNQATGGESGLTVGFSAYNSATFASSTEQVFQGTYSMKVTVDGVGPRGAIVGLPKAAVKNTKFAFYAKVWVPNGMSVDCGYRFSRQSNGSVSEGWLATIVGNGAWQTLSVVYTLSEAMSWVGMQFTTFTAGSFYLDSLSIVEQATPISVWEAPVRICLVNTYYPTTDKQLLMDYSRPRKNLLLPNQANGGEDGTTTGVSGANAGNTVTSSTEQAWQGARSFKAVCDGQYFVQGIQQTYKSEVKPNTNYTASVYLYGASGTIKLAIYEYTDAGVQIGSYIESSNITLAPEWTRYTLTKTSTETTRNIAIRVHTASKQAITFYIDGLQLEEGSVATPWEAPPNIGILGSEPGEDTNDPTWTGQGLAFATDDWVTLSGFDPLNATRTAFSIFVVVKMDALARNTAIVGQYAAEGGQRGWLLRTHNSILGQFNVIVSDDGSATAGHVKEVTCATSCLIAGQYALIGFTFDAGAFVLYAGPSPIGQGSPVLDAPVTTVYAPSALPKIGHSGAIAAPLTGTVAAVVGYSRALSDAEVAQAYAYLKGYLAKKGVVLP
jgi:hypothetical protein